MSKEQRPRVLGIQDIADDMGVSYNTARSWVLKEMRHYRTPGGTYRIELAHYEAWKASKLIEPRQPEVAA